MPDPWCILVVEDEWVIAYDHAEELSRAGHRVVGPARSVRVALDLLETERVDAAFLDVQLDDETSYRLADELRDRGIPFAFLTGFGSHEMPARFGRVPVLHKPAVSATLLAAIEGLVDRSPQAE